MFHSFKKKNTKIIGPSLTNPQNQKQWSEAIINDLVRHLSGLKNKSHEILGFMNGRTQLPIPAGAEKVTDKDIEMAKM